MTRPENAHTLRSAHQHLRHDKTVEVQLGSLDQLLNATGNQRSGVDVLVGILDSALRLPDALTVRLDLPEVADVDERMIGDFRDHCRVRASEEWEAATALRQGGFRELPRALTYAVVAALVGVVSGYLAEGVDSTLVMVFLYALAFVAVIAAWTIGWTPIEQALFDWRAPGHTASVYELLAHSRVEIVQRPRAPEVSPTVQG
ncbi:MAG: hypothetical protein WBC76_07580 [Actinomycetes bacterium]